jgi:protein TonB
LIACHTDFKREPIIVQPKLLFSKEPFSYPVEAFNLGIEGRTVIELMIDEEGNIIESSVLESSGSPLLDESALRMLKSSVYEPGTIDGAPGIFELHIPVHFRLANAYDLIDDIDNWLEQTTAYQEDIRNSTTATISELYGELYYHYHKMAREIGYTRSKNVNNDILNIVTQNVCGSWPEYRTEWPLGFLLYKDYINRYPDTVYKANAIDGLIRYLERDKKILEHYSYSKPPYSTIYSLILKELIQAYDQKHF